MINKEVTIHIGLCKTATTALQHWFSENRDILKNGNILYPITGIQSHHHFQIASLFIDNGVLSDKEKSSIRNNLCKEIEAWGGKSLFSSEHFSFIKKDELYNLADLIGYDATIIISLRNQVSWASAMYAESVRWTPSADFEQFLHSISTDLNFDKFVSEWEEVFGKDNIKIAIYDEGNNIEKITEYAGIDKNIISRCEPIRRVHPTFPALLVEIQRMFSQGRLNAFEIEESLKSIQDAFDFYGKTLSQETCLPYSFHGFFKRLDESNSRLAYRYNLSQPLFGKTIESILSKNIKIGYSPGQPIDRVIIEIFEHCERRDLINLLY